MGFDLLPDFSSKRSVLIYVFQIVCSGAIFLMTAWSLKTFLFTPVLKVKELRKKRIYEVKDRAEALQLKTADLKEEYQWRMEGAAQLAEEKRSISGLIARKRADMILIDVKRETARDLENVIKSADDAVCAVRQAMNTKIENYAKTITNKIIQE